MSAGHSVAPKDPDKRARRNKDPIPHTVLQFVPGQQPELPVCDVEWHPQTRQWWDVWGRSQIATTFTEADWSFLLDTARVHTMFWNGSLRAAGELRQRVAKFGSSPEDRARLRIFFATADRQDSDRPGTDTPPQPAQGFGDLKFTTTGDVIPISR